MQGCAAAGPMGCMWSRFLRQIYPGLGLRPQHQDSHPQPQAVTPPPPCCAMELFRIATLPPDAHVEHRCD